MKTVRLALAAAVVAFIAMVAPSPAQAYPVVTVTVSEATVIGGHHIHITATVDPSSINCDWTLTFLGDTRTGSGSSISETFSTPVVNHVEHHDAVATCSYTPSGAEVQSQATATGVGTQTLLPRHRHHHHGDDGDGDGEGGGILPNTGGERLLWLLIGGMLVVVGGGVVVASRRRDA